jgi:ribosomal protein S18 acetylase RimI-like enzyme
VTVDIRKATHDDLNGVLALYSQPELDDGRVLPERDAERIFARFARYPDYTLYVAESGEGIVGTFALLIMDNLGHLGAPSAIVEDVAVAPDSQGQGIGQAMMRFAMRKAQEKNCYKIVLSSNAKRTRAHAFYETLGFERHGFSFRVQLDVVPA